MNKTISTYSTICYLFQFFFDLKGALRIRLYFSVLFIIVSMLMNVSIPFIFKMIIDGLAISSNILNLILIFAVFWVIHQCSFYFREILLFRVVGRTASNLIVDFLRKIKNYYHPNIQADELLIAIDTVQKTFYGVFLGMFFYLIPVTIEIFTIALILIEIADYKFSLIILSMYLAYIAWTFISLKFAPIKGKNEKLENLQTQTANLKKILEEKDFEQLLSIDIDNEVVQFIKKREDIETKSFVNIEIIRLIQAIIVGIAIISTLYLSGIYTTAGRMSIGTFVLVNFYLFKYLEALSLFAWIFRDIKNSLTNITHALFTLGIKIHT